VAHQPAIIAAQGGVRGQRRQRPRQVLVLVQQVEQLVGDALQLAEPASHKAASIATFDDPSNWSLVCIRQLTCFCNFHQTDTIHAPPDAELI